MGEFDKVLSQYRAEIDAVDDQLIAMLGERSKIIEKVGELKAAQKSGKSIIRPGREADMIRRIAKSYKGKLAKGAIAAIWRLLISSSSNIEENTKITVYATDKDQTLYWLAREHYGNFTSIEKHSDIGRVLADVAEGKATAGVVPLPQESDEPWWLWLSESSRLPRVFAKVPFIETKASKVQKSGLAVGNVVPEASGDDVTLLVVKLTDNVSRSRLVEAFEKAKLTANVVASMDGEKVRNLVYLFEVEEFVDRKSEKLQKVVAMLGKSLASITPIGAYATPMKL